jgi:hypothetical protein
MPNFSNTPPVPTRGYGLPIRRTPTSGRLVAIVTSHDLVGCDTHFFGGHTVPCEKPDCEACTKGVPFRWHAYCGALDHETHLHFIFEMTGHAAEALVEYRDAHSGLRGCLFEAQRLNRRANGRVIIRTKPQPIEHIRLPQPPDLERCLSIIWDLPAPEVAIAGRLFNMPRVATVERGNGDEFPPRTG